MTNSTTPIVVLEIPHQRDAFAWIAWGGEEQIINHAHQMEDDNHRYNIYTLAHLEEFFDREDLPDNAWEIAERDGRVGEVNNDGFIPVNDMPSEFNWAVETLFADLSGGAVFRNHAEVLDDLEMRCGHQHIRAKIALECAAEEIGSSWTDHWRVAK
jgi:spore maturation protein CgeB